MNIEWSIWIYWGLCLVATLTVAAHRRVANGLLWPPSSSATVRRGYRRSLALAWALTVLTAGAYVLLTHKLQTGPYTMADLIAFALLNGVLEQLMFIFWFLAGCWLAKSWRAKRPRAQFFVGYLTFAVYSGLIHAWFWIKVLPPHVPAGAVVVPALSLMSLSWMWLLWRYRAIIAIVAMHVALDFVMVGYLHSHWFEVAPPN
jgi:chlorophyllide a hydrolase